MRLYSPKARRCPSKSRNSVLFPGTALEEQVLAGVYSSSQVALFFLFFLVSVHASLTCVSDVMTRDEPKCVEQFCTFKGRKYSRNTASRPPEDEGFCWIFLRINSGFRRNKVEEMFLTCEFFCCECVCSRGLHGSNLKDLKTMQCISIPVCTLDLLSVYLSVGCTPH